MQAAHKSSSNPSGNSTSIQIPPRSSDSANSRSTLYSSANSHQVHPRSSNYQTRNSSSVNGSSASRLAPNLSITSKAASDPKINVNNNANLQNVRSSSSTVDPAGCSRTTPCNRDAHASPSQDAPLKAALTIPVRSSVLDARRGGGTVQPPPQGAIIESMQHHGKGVFSGTFSGETKRNQSINYLLWIILLSNLKI